jgi:hypothetical protein
MTNCIAGALLTETYTPAQMEQGKGFGLGDRFTDHLGNEYVFVQLGAGGASPNFVLSIRADSSAVMATNTASLRGERVGVFVGDSVAAASSFGWAQIYGSVNVQSAVAAANAAMATTTTAGQIADAATTGTKQIVGLSLSAARVATAGLALANLVYPTVGATNP